MPPRLPEKVRRRVIPEFRKMANAAAVAARLDIGHTTVLRVLSDAGIPRASPTQAHPHRLSPEREREVVRRYVAGERSGAIAREMECSVFLVRKLAKKRLHHLRAWEPHPRLYSRADSRDEVDVGCGRVADGDRAQVRSIPGDRLRGASAAAEEVERHRCPEEKHGKWKGGQTQRQDGYVVVIIGHGDPMAQCGIHRIRRSTASSWPGRSAGSWSATKPFTTSTGAPDNRIENLELWHSRHPRANGPANGTAQPVPVGTERGPNEEDLRRPSTRCVLVGVGRWAADVQTTVRSRARTPTARDRSASGHHPELRHLLHDGREHADNGLDEVATRSR